MKNESAKGTCCYCFLIYITTGLLFAVLFPLNAKAQINRTGKSELATCQISVASETVSTQANGTKATKGKTKPAEKKYTPRLNQLGYFEQVSNIQPQQIVPVEVSYPNGRKGDKVVVAVADGGTLDNKKTARVIQLDNERKLSFSFQAASDPGIYRIFLRKGRDTKVIRLWVGAEPLPVKN